MLKLLIPFVILFIITQTPVYSQELVLFDKLSSGLGSINDFHIGPEKDRIYLINGMLDTFSYNNQIVIIDTTSNLPPFIETILYIKDDGSPKFAKNLGSSSGQIVVNDTSIFYFGVSVEDTLITSDTTFFKQTLGSKFNMYAYEYNLEGNLIKAKQWPTPHEGGFIVKELSLIGNEFFIVGEFDRDTLKFDDKYAIPTMLDFREDVFIAKFNSSWECQWIQSMQGIVEDIPLGTVTNSTMETYTTGYSASPFFYCGEDSIINDAAFFGGVLFLTKTDAEGNCVWLNEVDEPGGSITGNGAAILSDGSIVISGTHTGVNADFGDTTLVNPGSHTNGFIAKYGSGGDFRFAAQLVGDQTQTIRSITTTPTDGIWVCGGFQSESIKIGDFEFPRMGNTEDAFVAKYDKFGEVLYAASIWGNERVTAPQKIQTGQNENIYTIVRSIYDNDFIQIGDSTVILEDGFHSLIVEIKDEITNTKETINQNIELSIYPNPAKEAIFLEIPSDLGEGLRFQVVGLQGYVFLDRLTSPGKVEIPIAKLSAGIYFLNLLGSNKKIVANFKFVKN